MARFKMSPEVLAQVLDLPEGAELVGAEYLILVEGGQWAFEFQTKGGPLPDADIELHYAIVDGRIELRGFTEL